MPVRLFHKLAFGADGAPGASRTLVISRARDERPIRSAPPKCASCASSTIRRWRSRPSTRPARWCAPMPRFARLCAKPTAPAADRSILAVGGRARPRRAGSRDPPGGRGPGRHRAGRGHARRRGERLGAVLRHRGRGGRARTEAAIVYALETTEQRTLENQINQSQKMEIGRPARRRHRARLQQRAVRHHDGDRLPAERAQADRSVVPGHHADQAERQPGRERWCGSCWRSRAGRRCARRCSISARRCPI